uniref:Probable arginine--tRNA ligase, mitochondrial n=1 Tax=Culicoides sonorensis TaxID=179676 RepID=A0A336LYX9_CULSO
MSSQIRTFLSRKIADAIKHDSGNTGLITHLSTLLELDKNRLEAEFYVNMRDLRELYGKEVKINVDDILELDNSRDEVLQRVMLKVKPPSNEKVVFKVNRKKLMHETLENMNEMLTQKSDQKKTVVVEYSSPNIAKPFHVGHLRSTIIGNFISNLYEHLGHNVHRVNYLGDWGTQFGYLNVGVEMKRFTQAEIQQKPIEKLYEAYVHANQESEKDSTIHDKAMSIFRELENGTYKNIEQWNSYKKFTVEELTKLYDRLGVHFTHYHWESMYGINSVTNVVEKLNKQGVLHNENDGRKIAIVGDRRVPVVKSDGTTLYLTRDIAAYMDRYEKFKFDEMIYVVDNGQNDHFTALFNIIAQLKLPYAGRGTHVKFGRIKGMSTRKGSAVFLKDILDEAKDIMKEKQLQSSTTKIDISKAEDASTDILGISAVIINDLKQRRHSHYDFSWDHALQVTGDTGIKLQYTHCRLCSLEQNSGATEANHINVDLLQEPEAIALVFELAKFPEAISRAYKSQEACVIVNYLFSLW